MLDENDAIATQTSYSRAKVNRRSRYDSFGYSPELRKWLLMASMP